MIATWISNKLPFKSDSLLLHRFPCQKVTTKRRFGLWRESILKNHEDIFQNTTVTTNKVSHYFPSPQNATNHLSEKTTIIQFFLTQVTKGASRWINWTIWAIQFHLQMLHWSALTTCHLTRRFFPATWGGFFFWNTVSKQPVYKKWGLRKNVSLFRTSFMKHICMWL